MPAPTQITCEPRVMIYISGKPISFLLDVGASCLALPHFSGWTLPSQTLIVGINGIPTRPFMTGPFTCCLHTTAFTHAFLVLPTCPMPLLGQNILSKFKAAVTLYQASSILANLFLLQVEPDSPLLLPSSSVDPKVWDLTQPSLAVHHAPIQIHLKDPSIFTNFPNTP